jgi:hypothetical protein
MRIIARSFAIAAIAALLTLPAAAQGPTGKWAATVESEFGPFAFVLEFLVDAAGKMTGAMHNELIGQVPIRDGVAKGNDISFKLVFEGAPDGAITVNYTGTVKGDELALTSKVEGAPPGGGPAEMSFTAKRTQ